MKVSRIYSYLASKFKGGNLTPPSKTDADFRIFPNSGEADNFYITRGMDLTEERFGDRSVSDREAQSLAMEALNRP